MFRLANQINTKRIYTAGVIVGAVVTVLSWIASNIGQFVLVRDHFEANHQLYQEHSVSVTTLILVSWIALNIGWISGGCALFMVYHWTFTAIKARMEGPLKVHGLDPESDA